MATEAQERLSVHAIDTREPAASAVFALDAVIFVAYAVGAVALAGEAAVHLQQYVSLLHGVRWIGPLFLLNAAVSIVALAGLVFPPTRPLAALIGVASSAAALAALVVSYGRGLFGWFETGFRTPVELAVVAEVSAAVLLAVALAATLLRQGVDVAVLGPPKDGA
jgi:hypothetical protein